MRWCAAQVEAWHKTCFDPQAATVKTWPIFITLVLIRGHYTCKPVILWEGFWSSFVLKFRKSTHRYHIQKLQTPFFMSIAKSCPCRAEKRNVEANNGVESWWCPQMIIGLDEDLPSILMRLDSNMKTMSRVLCKWKTAGFAQACQKSPLNITEKGQWSLKSLKKVSDLWNSQHGYRGNPVPNPFRDTKRACGIYTPNFCHRVKFASFTSVDKKTLQMPKWKRILQSDHGCMLQVINATFGIQFDA